MDVEDWRRIKGVNIGRVSYVTQTHMCVTRIHRHPRMLHTPGRDTLTHTHLHVHVKRLSCGVWSLRLQLDTSVSQFQEHGCVSSSHVARDTWSDQIRCPDHSSTSRRFQNSAAAMVTASMVTKKSKQKTPDIPIADVLRMHTEMNGWMGGRMDG